MNIKTVILAVFLTSNVLAGGDDRDEGPVESLDIIAPVAVKVLPGAVDAKSMILTDAPVATKVLPDAVDAKSMTLTDTIGHTVSGAPITLGAHEACKDSLNLSDANIERFKTALASSVLYNTGPLDAFGTEFSPNRWADYFTCVESH